MKNNLQTKSGIYKITINDYYIYIGQSMDIKSRWNGHLNELRQNKHYNKKFQNVFNKYPNTIKYEVVEYCDVDKLDEREMYWINYYRSFNTNHGLNMNLGGISHRKYKTIEEAETVRKEYTKRWYRDNKDRIKEWVKQYRQENGDRIKENLKQYYRQKGVLSYFERRKLQFEKRYNLSRSLTNEEWNLWLTDKSISGNHDKLHANKFLKTLPDVIE